MGKTNLSGTETWRNYLTLCKLSVLFAYEAYFRNVLPLDW